MKQLMVEIIHPASNEILLIMRNRAPAWINAAKKLTDVGSAAYQAAQTKDAKALAALADPLDASCTACHKQFRPSIFAPVR
jgi:cytochrome c556